jgi:putative DNA primase/helicase
MNGLLAPAWQVLQALVSWSKATVAGPKAGLWCDYENGDGGDFLDLVMRRLGVGFREAVELALELVGQSALRVRERRPAREIRSASAQDAEDRIARAIGIWEQSVDPRGTVIDQVYLPRRRLSLPDDVAVEVVRFHPALKFETRTYTAMVALFRDIETDKPCGIHRTFIDSNGQKVGRKMLGRCGNAAIKLDPDENVGLGLHVGEGIESCLAARLAGFRPVWALGSAGAIASFPVLSGIEAITILGEVNDGGANEQAARKCASRWVQAGREALGVEPSLGDDLNDAWREAVT